MKAATCTSCFGLFEMDVLTLSSVNHINGIESITAEDVAYGANVN